jgi:3',5'-cyclic AMP phosphodiesterase CpdA
MTLTLAHLSDVHLPGFARPALADIGVKRGLGLLNWHRKRHRVHRSEVLNALLADLAQHKPDHIAVTGDLVNLGLPDEHAAALRWLEGLGPPTQVSVVPGNHDIYVRLRADPGVGRWQAYMTSDAWGQNLTRDWQGFPYVRRLGNVALIGLNSAVPTPPFVAGGRLGPDQLTRLPVLLDAAQAAGLVRIVLIHHPPLPGQASRMRGLADCDALLRTLQQHGADLVLHGHNHRDMAARIPGRQGFALGVPSFSAGISHGHEPLGRYNLLHIHDGPASQRGIELIGRGLGAPDGNVIELERRWIAAPQQDQLCAGKQ